MLNALRRFCLVPVLALSASLAFAADPPKLKGTFAQIADLIDEDTVAVGRLDVAKIDVAGIGNQMRKMGVADSAVKELEETLNGMQRSITKAGGKEVYALFSPKDLPGPPSVLIPLEPGANVDALKQLFEPAKMETTATLGHFLFSGGQRSLARLSQVKPGDKSTLTAAVAACGDTAIQVVILSSAEQRRVAGELMPKLPPTAGGGETKPLIDNFRWLALGVDSPPKFEMKLTINTPDAKAGAEAFDALTKVVEAVTLEGAKHPELPGGAVKAMALFKPELKGAEIVVAINQENGGSQKLSDILAPAIIQARVSAQQSQSINNLKQLGLAMHIYHDVSKSFPAAFTKSKDGKPLLSWRVAVLPYIEQQELYNEFHQNEPWDSDHNKKLIKKMPKLFGDPMSKVSAEGKTVYCTPRGENTIFPGAESVSIQQITDGTSQTLMIVQVDDNNAIEWTRPDDWQVDEKDPANGLGGLYKDTFLAAFADGSVRAVKTKLDPAQMKAMLSVKGGEQVKAD